MYIIVKATRCWGKISAMNNSANGGGACYVDFRKTNPQTAKTGITDHPIPVFESYFSDFN